MTHTRRRHKSGRASERGMAIKQWDMRFGPNMTPMVDVVMVILIFFMAGTALVAPEMFLTAGLAVEPGDVDQPGPEVADPFALPPARFTLRLSRVDGRTVIDGLGLHAGGLDALSDRLEAVAGDESEVAILIKPTPDVPFADVVAVHDRIERVGAARIGLLESGG